MPLIQISLVEGRDDERKHALIQGVTEAVVETLEVERDSVRVLVYEVPAANWARGGWARGGGEWDAGIHSDN